MEYATKNMALYPLFFGYNSTEAYEMRRKNDGVPEAGLLTIAVKNDIIMYIILLKKEGRQ